MSKVIIIQDPFRNGREVDFYLRLHRHLSDDKCCESIPFTVCHYRPDLVPINKLNDYVDKLQKDPEFRRKEEEIQEAIKNGKSW